MPSALAVGSGMNNGPGSQEPLSSVESRTSAFTGAPVTTSPESLTDYVELSVPPTRAVPPSPAVPVAPPLPLPPAGATPRPLPAEDVQAAKARIDALVHEARATTGAEAATLWFEAGRLFEYELRDYKSAAGHYQESHKADPLFLPVIHAARRLFAELGKWGMVLILIDEELKIPGAPVTALLVEKARILETRLARPDDAIALYQQALAHDRGDGPAIDGLLRHLEQRGSWTEVADVLRAGAAAARRVEQKGAWLVEVGRICEARLKDEDAAIAAYEEAERVMPARRLVLDSLRRLYARRSDMEKSGRVLERLADTAVTVSEAVTFLSERARMLASAGQENQAVEALELARERAPEDPLILGDLARLYERLEMWPSLVETLEAHARATRDRAEVLALFAEAGKLAEEKLQDPERAMRLYSSCIDVDPTYGPALTALGKLFAKAQRHRDLAKVYDFQIASTTDDQQRVNLLFKQAELLADKLSDPEAALQRLLFVLKLQPTWVPALKMTAALYARLERWEDLVRTYEGEISSMSERGQFDRDQAIFLLEKVAIVLEEKLGDPGRAIDVFKRMLQVQPGYLPALRSLGRLYARLERWDDLLAVNAEEAEMVSDQNQIVSLMFKNGEILAEKLGRVEEAIASYRQALTLMPNYLPALKALGSIYARAARHKDLIAMHREEVEVARSTEQRAHLLYMIAQIYDEKLKDKKAAIEAFRAVLDEDPTFHPAIRALARSASMEGDWDGLVGVYTRELGVLSEARDRALLRCRIAEIQDRRLGRPDDAITTLREAIADSSFLLSAHEQLVALLARLGRTEDEVKAREIMHQVLPDVDSRVANLRVLADHAIHQLDGPDRALDAAQRILFESAHDLAALRLALSCALKLRDYRLAIELAGKLAHVEPAAEEVANLHLQIAVWKDNHLDPPQDALPDYLRVLEYDPQNPTALRAAERAYVERQCWDGLYALYERECDRRTQPEIVADLSMKMGELAERRLGKQDLALECYERVLQARSTHLPAITRLKELYGKLARPSDELRMLSLEAQASRDPQRAIQTLLEVGALQRDQFRNNDAAIECFARVLERDPKHTVASQSLEALLASSGRWDELARLYMQRTAVVADSAMKVELLTKAAEILGERLKRFGAAAEAYERALLLAPRHAGALLSLGNLRYALQEWDGAAQSYSQLVQVVNDPVLLAPVHFHLGVIFSEHRVDPIRAIQHLTAALAIEPQNRDAQKRLARCWLLSGRPSDAVATYRAILDVTTDRQEKRELHVLLARIHEQSFQDLSSAGAELDAAMALTDEPNEQQRMFDEVASLYERANNLAGLIAAALKQAEHAAATDPKRAAEVLFRTAQIQVERGRDGEGALRSARRGLELFPGHTELRGFLADLYGRSPNQAPLAVEEHRRILRSGRVRIASVRALLRAWQGQRAHDRAFVAAEILSFLGAADDAEELFFHEQKKRVKKHSEQKLEPGQILSWLLHPTQQNPVHEVLSLSALELGKVLADPEAEPEDKKLVLKPRAEHPMRQLADEVANHVGLAGFDVHRGETRRLLVRAFTGAPPVLAIGVDVVKLEPMREQRFLIGREVFAIVAGHTLVRGFDARRLGVLITAIGRNIDKNFPLYGDGPELEGLTKKVGGALSRKTRAALGDPIAALMGGAKVDLRAFLEGARFSETRAGLLLSGAFDAAVRIIAKETQRTLASEPQKLVGTVEAEPRLADLVAYALSDEHFLARQALRLAIDS